MNKEKIRSKCFYFFSISLMCIGIVSIAYAFFLRTIEIDVTKDVEYIYTGENGSAKVVLQNKSMDLNQRVQEFLDTVVYEVSPDRNLSNGDILHVVATYDENLAEQYHFEAINTEVDVEVTGLHNRYETLEDIDEKYCEKIEKAQNNYISDHEKEIIEMNEDDSLDYRLENSECVYKAFLKSKSSLSDRMIAIYKMTYKQQEDTLDIYYLVTVPDINDGNSVNKQDIFGEKAHLTEDEKNAGSYNDYVVRIYSSQYDVLQMPIEKEIEEQKEE